jgi:hypothetical protein
MIGFLAKILVTNRFTFAPIVVSEMVDLSGYVNIIELLGVLKRTFGGNNGCFVHS